MTGTTRLTGRRKALLLIAGLALASLITLGVTSWLVIRSDLGCVRQNLVTLEPAPLEPGEVRADAPEQAIDRMEFPPELDVPPQARHLVPADERPENGVIRGDPPGPGDDTVSFDVFVDSRLHAKVSVSNYEENGWMVSGYRWCG